MEKEMNVQGLADLIKQFRERGAVHNRKGIVLSESKPDVTLFHMVSEVGELVEAFAYGTHDEVRRELGDCFNCLINLAYTLGFSDGAIYMAGAEKMRERFDLPDRRGD